MTDVTHDDPADRSRGPRLTGWKEIAAYLERGVRTAQRWEREFGLPVRRMGRDRSESVFAFESEIDTWLASASAARARGIPADDHERDPASEVRSLLTVSDSTSKSRLRLSLWLLATAVVVLGSVGIWREWSIRQTGPPASWRIEVDALVVFDAQGKELWRSHLPVVPDQKGYKDAQPGAMAGIEDLDGDGSREVWFVMYPPDGAWDQSRLYLFNDDGSIRWQYQHHGPVTFGPATLGGPWVVHRVFVTDDPADPARRALWVASRDAAEYPCVLERIDVATGKPQSTYWSNGWIDAVALWRSPRGLRLLVGGANNDHVAAGLAALDAFSPNGSAPAAHAKYRCTSCPPPHPKAFVVFPKPGRFAPHGSSGGVIRIDIGHDPTPLTISVMYSAFDSLSAVGTYRLDADFSPVHVDVGDTYLPLYELLVRKGIIPPYTHQAVDPEREMLPLYRWEHTRFVDVGIRPPDARAPSTPASSSTSSSPTPAR